MPDVVTDLFRSLMFFFDSVIYGFIPNLYNLITYLAQIDIFSTDDNIANLMGQIYALLGIFMLFKVSFSVLRYIIDPDSFSDGKKGIGRLVANVLIVVLLLVSVPYIFNAAYKLQYAIVSSDVIGELILGSSSGTDNTTDAATTIADILSLNDDNKAHNVTESNRAEYLKSQSTDLQFLMFGAFFSVNTDVLIPEGADPKVTDNQVCAEHPIIGSIEMATDQDCLETIEEYFKTDDDLINNGADLADYFPDGTNDVDNRNFAELDNILNWKINTEYVINYLPGISTITGIYLIFLLITFCIDIGLRAIKLCFLQMIAPISIVSYVDPTESSGDSKLASWAKECWKTYLSLFIRLAVIFLVLRFVSIIASGVFSDQGFASQIDSNNKIWVLVFLVLGAFVFAKQVPKLLESLLGMKSTGELQLNPLKAITSNPLASAAVGGAVGFAGGLATNAGNIIGKGVKAHGQEGGFRKQFLGVKAGEFSNAEGIAKARVVGRGAKNLVGNTLGTLAGGAIAGAVHTGKATAGGKIPEGIKSGHDKVIAGREERDAKQQQSVKTRIQNVATQFAGVKNEFGGVGAADKEIKNLNEQLQRNAQIQNSFREQFAEVLAKSGLNSTVINNVSNNSAMFKHEDYVKAVGEDKAVSKVLFDRMDYYTRYKNIEGKNATDVSVSQREDFNNLMNIRANENATVDIEKDLKKQKSDLERASGIKKEDKPKLGE